MKIEHVALNVADPVAMGRWYVEHLGLRVKRSSQEPPYGHFLADDRGTVMIELYQNPSATVPDYRQIPAAVFHLAFVSDDVPADVRRLTAAGGQLDGEIQVAADGDQFAIVRDPWGLALQFVKRHAPMIDG